jgi:hypothetical protein
VRAVLEETGTGTGTVARWSEPQQLAAAITAALAQDVPSERLESAAARFRWESQEDTLLAAMLGAPAVRHAAR